MPTPRHTVESPDGGDGYANKDKIVSAIGLNVANAAGGGAGVSVTVAVTGLKNLPAKYIVTVNPKQDATWWVTAQTSTGFTINLSPRLAASTLASGTVDWKLEG